MNKEELDKAVLILRREASAAFREKNYEGIKPPMLKAWEIIPEPKLDYGESFLVARMMCEAALGLNDKLFGEEWLEIYKTADLDRIDSGERDFMEARFAYASNDLAKAKTCFEIAEKKSDGRCWKADGVMDYFKFYKSK